jgi:hypothetical protein
LDTSCEAALGEQLSCPRSTADRKRSTAHTGQMHSVQTSARSFAAPMVSAVVSPFT